MNEPGIFNKYKDTTNPCGEIPLGSTAQLANPKLKGQNIIYNFGNGKCIRFGLNDSVIFYVLDISVEEDSSL